MKYAIVTGSSGGVGLSLVKRLIEDDVFVFGLDMKNIGFEDKNFKFFKCDLTNKESISDIKNEIKKVATHIDYILNIAGIFMLESIVEGSEEDLRKIFEVNFFGTYNLNRSMLELLDKTSKILVFTSEVARYSPQPFNAYYALPKIILDRYTDILRRELNYLDIKVIKVQAGAIKTGLLDGVEDKYFEMVNNSTHYKKPLTKLKKLMDNEIKKQTSPEIISKKLVKIINKKHPRITYRIKNSFSLSFLNALPEKLQDIIYKNVIK